MNHSDFETLLGRHCSPVLLGRKPSNLISLSKESVPDFREQFEIYSRKLSRMGISLKVLCGCRRHYLMLVYREDMLNTYVRSREAEPILVRHGYSTDMSLEGMLEILSDRFMQRENFPHEIGLFLGYPIEDIEGFCKYKGANSKYCGYWKVYGNVDKARETFAEYDRCRTSVLESLQAGYSIIDAIQNNYRQQEAV